MTPQHPVAAADPSEAPTLSAVDRVLSRVEDGFTLLAALCIFILMLLGIVQVLGRQLFDHPIAGYIDFVELAMSTFAFMGIAYCQRTGGHVRMDLFVNMAEGRTRWLIELGGVVVALALMSVLTWYSWDHFIRALDSGDSTIDLELPVWPSKLLVPVSFGLLCVRLVVQLAGYLRLVLKPDATEIAVPRMPTAEDFAHQDAD